MYGTTHGFLMGANCPVLWKLGVNRLPPARQKMGDNLISFTFGACDQQKWDAEATTFVSPLASLGGQTRLRVCWVLCRGQGLGAAMGPAVPCHGSGLGALWGRAGGGCCGGPALLAGDSRWQQEIGVPSLWVGRQGPCVSASPWHFAGGQQSAAPGCC